jgi:hypothetical protein
MTAIGPSIGYVLFQSNTTTANEELVISILLVYLFVRNKSENNYFAF